MNPLALSHPSFEELSEKGRTTLARYRTWLSAENGLELVSEMQDLLTNLHCAVERSGWENGKPSGWNYDYSYEEFDRDVTLLIKEIKSISG